MKKSPRKLTLNRETLRHLEEWSLQGAAGATGSCWFTHTQHTECNTDCPYCPTEWLTTNC